MTRIAAILCLLLAAALGADASAAPKKSSTGVACTSTGTERKDGKDQATGETFNCLFDTCTFCAGPNGELDCSIKKTEYSNARDCHAAAQGGGASRQPGILSPGVLDPGSRPTHRPLKQTTPPGAAKSKN